MLPHHFILFLHVCWGLDSGPASPASTLAAEPSLQAISQFREALADWGYGNTMT